MQPNASVAVVIVNWNSGDLLRRALECLARQTLPPAITLVVDNASSDSSADRLAPISGLALEVIRLDRNTGFAAANNLAISRLAEVDWIALLNPDAFPEPDWLEKLLGAARRNPAYAIFASCQLMANAADRFDGEGDAYHVSGLHWRRSHGEAVKSAGGETEVFSACAAAALYRADALRAAGGFDAGFFCYAEDVDLGFRLRLMGYRCLYVPDAVVHHVGSATTGRRSDFAVYHGHRNLEWVYFKNMPTLLLWLYLPQHLLLNLATIVLFTLRGQGRVILRAKRDALTGLPRVLRQRGEIRKVRAVGTFAIRRAMARGVFVPYARRMS